jgi:hypothetical protein
MEGKNQEIICPFLCQLYFRLRSYRKVLPYRSTAANLCNRFLKMKLQKPHQSATLMKTQDQKMAASACQITRVGLRSSLTHWEHRDHPEPLTSITTTDYQSGHRAPTVRRWDLHHTPRRYSYRRMELNLTELHT